MYINNPEDNQKYAKPRGFYTDKTSTKWSKDTSPIHFEGFHNKVVWPLIKLIIMITIYFAATNIFGLYWAYSIILCMFVLLTYQHLVALVHPNTIVMSAMDHQTFITNDNSIVNFMNCSQYYEDSEEAVCGAFRRGIHRYPKFRYRIKEIAGDYYYEEMGI